MYLEHFGLREFPFSLAPDPRYLYLSPQHREALAHLLYGVESEGGFVQLTGEVGTGKTTICRCFLEQLPPATHVAVILNPGLTAEELLATICDEFHIPHAADAADAAGVKAALDRINRYLLDVHGAGERAVLVIDEAQNLDGAALEQVRLLTNLETSRHKLLQVILMGQPELRATLSRADLRQLTQRITARFHLQPLSRQETAAYVRHRLEVAGCQEELFPATVIGRLQRLSRGVPRLINILADRALLGAFVQGKRQVDGTTLAQAAREVAGRTGSRAIPWRLVAPLLGVAFGLITIIAALRVIPPPHRPAALPEEAIAPPAAGSPAAVPGGTPPAPVAPAVPAAPPAQRVPPPPQPSVPAAARGASPPSGVLRALLEQSEAQSENEAWQWLYRLWGIRVREDVTGCGQALVHGLDCLLGEGGLEQMRRLDRPAVIRVYDHKGAPRWLIVERVRERQVTLSAGGAQTAVDIAKLEPYGIREFVLLWRPPPQTRGALAAGDRGPGVSWLAQRLDEVEGRGRAAPASEFDGALAERVRAFQRASGLVADGIAGPETLLLLDRKPAPGTPTLAGER